MVTFRNIFWSIFLSVVLLFPINTTWAEEAEDEEYGKRIVVTATKTPVASEEVGSSVTVITSEEMKKKQIKTAADALRSVLSVDVVNSGGRGGNSSVFMRGANSEHTLVLIDGIEVNDPSSAGRTFNFTHIMADDIEKIEIIRGPQSTLYGSDAMGGVINIITKQGKDDPKLNAQVEGGSFGTFVGSARVSGSTDMARYSLTASRLQSDGFSAATVKAGNEEKDKYENTSLGANVGFDPMENLSIDLNLKHIDGKADIDGGAFDDDINFTSDTKTLYFKALANLFLFDEMWEQKLSYSQTSTDREFINRLDPAHPQDSSENTFDGGLQKVEWQNNLYLIEDNTLTLGVELEEEKGESFFHSESSFGPFTDVFDNKKQRTTSFYAQDQAKLAESLHLTAGVRVDDNDQFGSHTTYRGTVAYILDQMGMTVKGSYGTGFKAPSLFQLFSQYGDENLKPEESTGWDIGIEKAFNEGKSVVGATYFNNEFKELINFDFGTSKYLNVGEAETKGFELFARMALFESMLAQIAYNQTDAKNKDTGQNLFRRPKNKFSADLNLPLFGLDTTVSLLHVGERDAQDFTKFPAEVVTLSSYTLLNTAVSFDVTDSISLFGRVENITDEDYEEVLGFNTAERSYYIGISGSLI